MLIFPILRFGGKRMEPKIQDSMTLFRTNFTDVSTIGEISFDEEFFCFSLEDTARKHKIHGKTAIPPGRYEIIINHSEKFGKDMPLLLDVPGFEGVRIHSGNVPDQTDGCIFVGLKKGNNAIYDSRLAYQRIFGELEARLKRGKVYLSVIGGREV